MFYVADGGWGEDVEVSDEKAEDWKHVFAEFARVQREMKEAVNRDKKKPSDKILAEVRKVISADAEFSKMDEPLIEAFIRHNEGAT